MKRPRSQGAVLLFTESDHKRRTMEDCSFLLRHTISRVDLKQLCEDVQAIARKCGENIMKNYGREFYSLLLRSRHRSYEDEGHFPGSCNEGGC